MICSTWFFVCSRACCSSPTSNLELRLATASFTSCDTFAILASVLPLPSPPPPPPPLRARKMASTVSTRASSDAEDSTAARVACTRCSKVSMRAEVVPLIRSIRGSSFSSNSRRAKSALVSCGSSRFAALSTAAWTEPSSISSRESSWEGEALGAQASALDAARAWFSSLSMRTRVCSESVFLRSSSSSKARLSASVRDSCSSRSLSVACRRPRNMVVSDSWSCFTSMIWRLPSSIRMASVLLTSSNREICTACESTS
mmetsp:Transcript_67640/g.174245  ORF Transcript_67640/g.174245 Transcript_67640/m.174245 type:complete len:258 (+) Transcript_67640:1700-2473(+)